MFYLRSSGSFSKMVHFIPYSFPVNFGGVYGIWWILDWISVFPTIPKQMVKLKWLIFHMFLGWWSNQVLGSENKSGRACLQPFSKLNHELQSLFMWLMVRSCFFPWFNPSIRSVKSIEKRLDRWRLLKKSTPTVYSLKLPSHIHT